MDSAAHDLPTTKLPRNTPPLPRPLIKPTVLQFLTAEDIRANR